jgi:LmbE family N-acetylglucosaminyl deacetylase
MQTDRRLRERVLVIAAHPDDEVLGVGGTMVKHVQAGDLVEVLIVTEGCSTQYPGKPEMVLRKQGEAREAARLLGVHALHFGGLPDMKLDTLPISAVNGCIEAVVQSTQPSIVYTQAEHDINVDHRLVFSATMVACRPYSAPFLTALFSYFTPSSSEWGSQPFAPTFFRDISGVVELKLKAMEAYNSELRPAPHPRSLPSLLAISAGFGAAVGCQHAEAFRLIREVQRD